MTASESNQHAQPAVEPVIQQTTNLLVGCQNIRFIWCLYHQQP